MHIEYRNGAIVEVDDYGNYHSTTVVPNETFDKNSFITRVIDVIAKDLDDGVCADCKMFNVCHEEADENRDCIEYHRDYVRGILSEAGLL